ncbi:MAG TPA: histidinol dehydrogenase [Flavihumibacter sp.]|nr:histidinol dehydrogenase [Bacteroidota bacterium]HOA37820.1 histidinol dehydrogenase [Flavihumibacter sp.]HQD10982.1 histidinol dehydrogenase [Flavihumibacter sp.]
MIVNVYPARKTWPTLLKRPTMDHQSLLQKVRPILEAVKAEGDAAVTRYTLAFDAAVPAQVKVSTAEIDQAKNLLSDELKAAIQQAAANIRRFHLTQRETTEAIETMEGVRCWRQSVGIEKVGLYIPGGTAPLFSTLLMLGIPAVIAGCKEIVLCSPPAKDGSLHPAILFAASEIGIRQIFKVGGVQAIAAMAYGTATIPKVYKIFGPGNQYVTCAKQLVQQDGIAIDMPAGPSEVAILADESAHPAFIAADLLSQAEHGPDSQVLLVTTHAGLIEEVETTLQEQLKQLPRQGIAEKVMRNSHAVVLASVNEAMDLLNEYGPEHLILAVRDAAQVSKMVVNAGSVFIGHYSPESAGDYASGTNHTLPTNGYAKAYSGVSVDSFVKKITFQQLTETGIRNIGNTVAVMARAEGLDAHARAVTIRLEQLQNN